MNTAFLRALLAANGNEGAAPSADRGKICRAAAAKAPAFPPLSVLRNWHGPCDHLNGDKAFSGTSP
jgi:hypothetical protein